MVVALGVFAVWTIATYLLEGRIQTLLRPEAAADRLVYALVANIVIGTVVGILTVGALVRRGLVEGRATGFRNARHALAAVLAGIVIGGAFLVLQRPASLHPVVLLNAFAQVLVVSVAEVVVCWAVVAASIEAALGPRRVVSVIAAIVGAAVLFGIYHYVHSPPFNTLAMVAWLTLVGAVTGVFFFVSRDVYGTIAFHNMLALYGVTDALSASGRLTAYGRLQLPLIVMALISVAAVAVTGYLAVRRTRPRLAASDGRFGLF